MSKVVFFGDSLTSGENNRFNGFVKKLNWNAFNFGVSGTTIGDYSLYPVGQNNLLDKLSEWKTIIASATDIFLEYGANDVSSIITGYINENNVYIDLIKALDYIKQTSGYVNIYFILLDDNNAKLMAKGQCEYLKSNYLESLSSKMHSKINTHRWLKTYRRFKKQVKKIMCNDVIEIDCDLTGYICEDGIHPNDEGYQLMAACISNKLKGSIKYE